MIYRRAATVDIKASNSNPPGRVTAVAYKDYPSDAQLMNDWTKMD